MSENQQALPTSQCGVIYIASGTRYRAEAVESARTLKRFNPDLPCVLFSDQTVDNKCFDSQEILSSPSYNFIDKIEALKWSPFEKTLFLDTDTTVLCDITSVFDLLDRFDCAFAHEPARYLYPIAEVPSEFPEFNTGVILYNARESFANLVDDWLKRYQSEIETKQRLGAPQWHDQISFTKSVWHSRVSFLVLPPEWNFRAPLPQFLSGQVRILHGRLRDANRDVSFVNEKTTPRIMNPNPSRFFRDMINCFKLFRILARS